MNMHRLVTFAATCACIAAPLAGQGTYVLRGGTVHTMNGAPIENGTVVVVDGRITAVGAGVPAPAGAEIVDVTGKHVYPGMFNGFSQIGLTEIGRIDAMNDTRELGEFNPHLQAATAVHPDGTHIPVTRANGVTHSITAPQGSPGGLAGQASVIHLDGWTIEEMLVDAGAGMVMAWPSVRSSGRGFGRPGAQERSYQQRKRQADERIEQVEDWLTAARHYRDAIAAGVPTSRDLKLEALVTVVNGDMPLLITANAERDIRAAIEFGDRNEVDIVIFGGNQAWKMADELAERGTKLVLGPTQAMPTGADESYDEAYAGPGILHATGVTFGFGTGGSSNSRTLPYEAAMAVGFGLPHDVALRAVTVHNAEIFGLGDHLGTLEVGKLANLIVTDGDPLNIQTQVEYLMIAGRPTSTENKHQSLYERYRSRR